MLCWVSHIWRAVRFGRTKQLKRPVESYRIENTNYVMCGNTAFAEFKTASITLNFFMLDTHFVLFCKAEYILGYLPAGWHNVHIEAKSTGLRSQGPFLHNMCNTLQVEVVHARKTGDHSGGGR